MLNLNFIEYQVKLLFLCSSTHFCPPPIFVVWKSLKGWLQETLVLFLVIPSRWKWFSPITIAKMIGSLRNLEASFLVLWKMYFYFFIFLKMTEMTEIEFQINVTHAFLVFFSTIKYLFQRITLWNWIG